MGGTSKAESRLSRVSMPRENAGVQADVPDVNNGLARREKGGIGGDGWRDSHLVGDAQMHRAMAAAYRAMRAVRLR